MKKALGYSLASDECVGLLGGNVKFITYDEVADYNSIQDLLSPYGKVILLYMNGAHFGHYTCLQLLRDGRTISFFDSYAYKPDGEFEFINKDRRRKYNYTGYPPLNELLMKAMREGYNIDYNAIHLQSDDESIATCGRWCCLRLLFDNMGNDQFSRMIEEAAKKMGKSNDELAVILTKPYLGK